MRDALSRSCWLSLGRCRIYAGFVTSELEAATAETSARFEGAAASIRRDIQAGRESSDRQMAEIRRFIFELNTDDDDNDGHADGSRN